jgi:hypothetical protein
MGIELDKAASYHVRISSLHVRLKCDIAGCWNLGRAAMEFADDVGRPVEHRVVCNQHTQDEIEKVKGVAKLTIHDERAGRLAR